MALYGKVVKIFDETALLVNLGSNDGLKRGDLLAVVEKGDEVTDPETGESLGVLELVKAELIASDVQERMSILRTVPARETAVNLPLSARMARDSVKLDRVKGKMIVNQGDISGIGTPSPVKVGDPVRLIE
jgi:hypothetical protein